MSVTAAFVFLAALALTGLAALLQFNRSAVLLGLACWSRSPSTLHEAHHPLAAGGAGDRLQLGGADGLGGAARGLELAPHLLFCGCVLWTIGYDTIYAHQDKEDDAIVRGEVDGADVRDGDRRCCGCSMAGRSAASSRFA